MKPFNWECPYCNSKQTAVEENTYESSDRLHVGDCAEGRLATATVATACQNPDCKKTMVHFVVGQAKYDARHNFQGVDYSEPIYFSKRVCPRGKSRSQPNYIPSALREDYEEACLIADESPKAAATLTRRCLQGMIRDFANIKRSTLAAEINALRDAVDNGTADRAITPESVDAIDHVRGIGNIGAHMEKDINLIIPVERDEVTTLIELVEMLFDEWYVARQTRQARLQKIEKIASTKAETKKGQSGSTSAPSDA